MQKERRRSPRIPGEFWVVVEGVDEEPVLVAGDVSLSGICFVRDDLPCEVGGMETLSIGSSDRRAGAIVLAQLVRTGTMVDRTGRKRRTAAFRFLPDSETVAQALRELHEHVAKQRQAATPPPAANDRPAERKQPGDQPSRARVFPLGIARMQVETVWPIKAGDKVQLVLQPLSAEGARLPFEGMATHVQRGPTGTYCAEVNLGCASARTAFPVSNASTRATIIDSVDLAFAGDEILDLQMSQGDDEVIDLEDVVTSDLGMHLAGRLDRIAIASLFSLFELERMSGELKVTLDGKRYSMFWSEGRPVDLDLDDSPPRSYHDALATMVAATEGTFQFIRKDVDRPDQFNASATALMLDLAREADEADEAHAE